VRTGRRTLASRPEISRCCAFRRRGTFSQACSAAFPGLWHPRRNRLRRLYVLAPASSTADEPSSGISPSNESRVTSGARPPRDRICWVLFATRCRNGQNRGVLPVAPLIIMQNRTCTGSQIGPRRQFGPLGLLLSLGHRRRRRAAGDARSLCAAL
jgi:hypothetical protein